MAGRMDCTLRPLSQGGGRNRGWIGARVAWRPWLEFSTPKFGFEWRGVSPIGFVDAIAKPTAHVGGRTIEVVQLSDGQIVCRTPGPSYGGGGLGFSGLHCQLSDPVRFRWVRNIVGGSAFGWIQLSREERFHSLKRQHLQNPEVNLADDLIYSNFGILPGSVATEKVGCPRVAV